MVTDYNYSISAGVARIRRSRNTGKNIFVKANNLIDFLPTNQTKKYVEQME
jgi:nucleoid DNA-binding protein